MRRHVVVVAAVVAIAMDFLSAQSGGGDAFARRAGSIAGRVIRSDGTAAADTPVFIGNGDPSRGPSPWIASTRTSFDGRYEIRDLPPGAFVVGASTGPIVTMYPGVQDPADAIEVRVFEGVPTEGIDIWLAPARPFSVSGQVFDPLQRELRNVTIEYTDPEGTRVWVVSHPLHEFTIENAAIGTLVLVAHADSTDGPLVGIAATDVRRGAVEDVRILLGRPATVEGRLRLEQTLPTAREMPNIALTPTLIAPSVLYPAPPVAIGSDGYFRATGLLGDYEVNVGGLPDGWRVKHVLREGRTVPGNRLSVAAGEAVTDLEIVVGPGPT